jgi:hypothetical protein
VPLLTIMDKRGIDCDIPLRRAVNKSHYLVKAILRRGIGAAMDNG